MVLFGQYKTAPSKLHKLKPNIIVIHSFGLRSSFHSLSSTQKPNHRSHRDPTMCDCCGTCYHGSGLCSSTCTCGRYSSSLYDGTVTTSCGSLTCCHSYRTTCGRGSLMHHQHHHHHHGDLSYYCYLCLKRHYKYTHLYTHHYKYSC